MPMAADPESFAEIRRTLTPGEEPVATRDGHLDVSIIANPKDIHIAGPAELTTRAHVQHPKPSFPLLAEIGLDLNGKKVLRSVQLREEGAA
eukprot:gene13402-15834_t